MAQLALSTLQTVLNSGFNFSQFRDGRASTLEQQIDGPIQSEIEMGSTWPELIEKLKCSQEYVRDFRQIYGDEIQSDARPRCPGYI